MMIYEPLLASAPAFSMSDVLSPYIYVFYAAFLVSFFFTPLMQAVALHYGIIDQPDNIRKVHKAPVAYLGGIAVFLGWLTGLATSQFLSLHRQDPGRPSHVLIAFGIVAGASLIVLLGLWDDVKHIKPYTKIAGQIAAAVMLLASDIGTHCSTELLDPIGSRIILLLSNPHLAWLLHSVQWVFGGWPVVGSPHVFPEWFIVFTSSFLVIAVVVACCNATNLMDGLDGLCGGVTAVVSGGLLFLAVHLAAQGIADNVYWDAMRIVMALALLGGVLGFVPFNFNPASIFMGDTGSMFLGYACATIMILMAQGQHPQWFLASLIIFALPILDTTLAFARRWVNKRPFFSADRHHIHHQLVQRGFTVKQTVLISYGLAIFFALLGVAVVYMRMRFAGAIYLVVFGSIVVAAFKMGMVHERVESVAPKGLEQANSAEDAVTEASPSLVLKVDVQSPTEKS